MSSSLVAPDTASFSSTGPSGYATPLSAVPMSAMSSYGTDPELVRIMGEVHISPSGAAYIPRHCPASHAGSDTPFAVGPSNNEGHSRSGFRSRGKDCPQAMNKHDYHIVSGQRTGVVRHWWQAGPLSQGVPRGLVYALRGRGRGCRSAFPSSYTSHELPTAPNGDTAAASSSEDDGDGFLNAWVVFQGYCPGVYYARHHAEEQVRGCAQGLFTGFHTRDDAWAAFRAYLTKGLTHWCEDGSQSCCPHLTPWYSGPCESVWSDSDADHHPTVYPTSSEFHDLPDEHCGPVYVVFQGKIPGLYSSRFATMRQVSRVSLNNYSKYANLHEARSAFAAAFESGAVVIRK